MTPIDKDCMALEFRPILNPFLQEYSNRLRTRCSFNPLRNRRPGECEILPGTDGDSDAWTSEPESQSACARPRIQARERAPDPPQSMAAESACQETRIRFALTAVRFNFNERIISSPGSAQPGNERLNTISAL